MRISKDTFGKTVCNWDTPNGECVVIREDPESPGEIYLDAFYDSAKVTPGHAREIAAVLIAWADGKGLPAKE